MSEASAGNNQREASERDDLTLIKGIGPARQRLLRESLDVRTFHDLADLEAEELASRLKAEGQGVSLSEIKRWIAQAQDRAEVHEPAPERQQEELPESEGEAAQADNSTHDGRWKPFASFVVEFQARVDDGRTEDRRTAVHYVEADRNETWSGLAGEQLLQWMREQAGEKMHEKQRVEPVSEEMAVDEKGTVETVVDERPSVMSPDTQPTVNVAVDRIRAYQPARSATPQGVSQEGRPFSNFITSNDAVSLEVSFELADPPSSDLVYGQVTYRAEFRATNLSTRETVDLGSTEPAPLIEGQTEYAATLPDVMLQPGMYRLHVLTVLELKGKSIGMGYLEVPLVQVV